MIKDYRECYLIICTPFLIIRYFYSSSIKLILNQKLEYKITEGFIKDYNILMFVLDSPAFKTYHLIITPSRFNTFSTTASLMETLIHY